MSGREIELLQVAAFTSGGAGGNPAGLVLGADGLSTSDKQALASRAGLSETAFISRSEVATLKLEFFTPTRQIAHCGHATIAAFGYLGASGRLPAGRHTKETIDGLREVFVDGGRAAMQQRPPVYDDVDAAEMLSALGLTPSQVDRRFAPVRVDTGNGFVLVGLNAPDDLTGVTPDLAALHDLSELHDLVGVYVFALTPDSATAATTRMFAPRYGIAEEAATGMAAGPLGCLLNDRGLAGASTLIEQGRFMHPPSPSRLQVDLTVRDGRIQDVRVSGEAQLTGATRLRL
ncbi:PhzF family phenazine biosynthesis protein [Phenylobacterium deserti]|uniref:PhzF family phenazine biosynthesis protein n=1 Tax=Phenylobacterium deserti TaxID=1914756 RepID=A0A328AD47_9CAUL|nr:PhzF family phenazine biosynthesis protein [Phenylobacterium deserti]RAK52515.1 PhzF family phenazine biosynthesis protein [Phenylobacterium deserti]